MGRFINYGEIGKEEEKDPVEEKITPSVTSINIEDIKNNSEDINQNKNSSSLDNLLNLNGQKNFITPAEKIVKSEPNNDNLDKLNNSKYYFSPSDLTTLNLPQETSNIIPTNNSMMPTTNVIEKNYTIEEATEKVRNLVKDLKDHGINIDTDEMNFEKSYQIIIKIYKENN